MTTQLSLTVNGEPRRIMPGASIADHVRSLELNPQKVAVERNGAIAPRSALAEVILSDGDVLEIVHFVGGGSGGGNDEDTWTVAGRTFRSRLIVGTGKIGSHLAGLCKAFGMKVLGIRRDPSKGTDGCDSIHGMGELVKLAPQADYVVLACALTPETTGLMSAAAFAAMKPSATFVNVARGKVADEAALIATMKAGKIAAASIDVTAEEPLPAVSLLWELPNVFITPHTAGETRAYEDNVIDILLENLDRLWRGEKTLQNQVL